MKSDALPPMQTLILRPQERLEVQGSRRYAAPNCLYSRVYKRALDLILATMLIVLLLSWMLPLLLVLVCLDSKGPLFFVQKRVGYKGRVFPCLKIRTMRPLVPGGESAPDEKRITRIGWWLRLTHIDELPQLLNVLRNEMSLVGPRPHMVSQDAQFALLLPQYQQRQLLKPGITGLAQVRGFYGEAVDYFSIAGRIRLDLFYIHKMSPGLDLSILLKTLLIVPVRVINRLYAGSYRRQK
jgi:putative colanic acid biosynthesis UDP-glucose lipid carrier transferase